MPDKSVRPRVDELVFGSNRHVDGEESSEMNDGIPANKNSGSEEGGTDHAECRTGQSCESKIVCSENSSGDGQRDHHPKDGQRMAVVRPVSRFRSPENAEDNFGTTVEPA